MGGHDHDWLSVGSIVCSARKGSVFHATANRSVIWQRAGAKVFR
jgi:hypothetical protein